MEVSAAQVKALREKTGAGMMDCKAALGASNGDLEAAVRYLREKGLATAAKRAGKVAAEGLIVATPPGTLPAAMLELNCETDFVAKTPQFQELASSLLAVVAADGAIDGVVSAEEAGLGARKLPAGKTIAEAVADSIASLGESIVPRRVARVAGGEAGTIVGSYVHAGGKIGVLMEARCAAPDASVTTLLKDLAMQVVAASPRFLQRGEVPAGELDKEREIYRVQAKQTGKPDNVVERIVDGKIEKFYSEACLLEQEFIKDPQTTVTKLVEATGKKLGTPVTLVRFLRFQLGESSGEA